MNKYQEAIKLFEKIIDNEAYKESFQDACKLAVEVLEKATPKKPIECVIEDEEYEDFDHSYIVTYKGYKCSNCGQLLFIEVIYDKKPFCCSHCMQVVDWSEEDE